MARPADVGVVRRLSVGLTEDQAKVVDELAFTKQEGRKIRSEGDAVRFLLDKALKGKVARIKAPVNTKRTFPRLHGVCCGTPESLIEALQHADEVELTDSAALAWATPHAWVGVAEGWSMRDQRYPNSISEGDELLMVPIDEWKHDITPGTAVLSYVQLKDGTEGCSLKEHMGKTLRARNPNFDKIDFGLGGDVEYGCPLAVCVWRLGRCMV